MRGVAAGALALLVLAGCSSGSKTSASGTAPETTTSTVAACPAGPAVPAGVTDLTSGPGDFDGDGRPDRLSTYRLTGGGAWRVRVELLSGGSAEAELPASANGVKALGGSRLDVGPSEAALVVTGSSGAGQNVGLFVLVSCKLQRVTLAGAPAEFPVQSAAANSRNGVACQAAGLVAYSATSTNGQTFQASSVSYLLEGAVLDEVHRNTMQLGATDAALAAYGAFSCGTLKL